ncbi:phytanoyl-CoA hydroxylase [Capsaspora owczarzaki ATCC 30864]|nr:phytanoyl-CoA hydroxylase [Capsaspora owczarzaki ATCC 30864]|eukprot:XP_004345745.1 phytanoyl-CoA hydroxylase [Capsaspora owczarzaki ATCC 30864]
MSFSSSSSSSSAAARLAVTLGHLAPQHASFGTADCAAAALTTQQPAKGNKLKYTHDIASTILTREQRRFYEDNGFLLVKKLIDPSVLNEIKDHFVALCNGEKERFSTTTVMRDVTLAKQKGLKGERAVTKVQDFQDDPDLFRYCQLPEVLKYVQCFTGPNIRTIHTMLINKPPDVGPTGRHPLHQDLVYFPMEPANRICCSWTAMEPVTRANGCLVVLPGTHKGELLEHGYPEWEGGVNKAYHGIKSAQQEKGDLVYLEMEPGDTVFFHPILIHGSGANKTSGYRKAISGHYASAGECSYIDVTGGPREELAREIEEMAKAKLRTDEHIKIQDIWRMKSRLVQGEDVTLI